MLQIKLLLLFFILVFTDSLSANTSIVIPGYSSYSGWQPEPKTKINTDTYSKAPLDSTNIFFSKPNNNYIKWNNHETNTHISYKLNKAYNFTAETEISFMMYSKKNTNTKLNLILKTHNKNYLRYPIDLNWTGWKVFSLGHDDFISSLSGKSTNISSISIISNGWKTKPSNLNEIIISDIRAYKRPLNFQTRYTLKHTPKSIIYTHHITIKNLLKKSIEIKINELPFDSPDLTKQSSHNKIWLRPNEDKTINISTEINYDAYLPLKKIDTGLIFFQEENYLSSLNYYLVSPLKQTTSSLKTIINDRDIDNIKKTKNSKEWIKRLAKNIDEHTNNINDQFYEKYGVNSLSPPMTGGEWGMKYISKDRDNIYIKPESFKNYKWLHCTDETTCSRNNTFDKVIQGRIHNDLAIGTFHLGLAYKLHGDETYFKKAEKIIEEYVSKYLEYPLHGINETTVYNQARIHSQNFEEARWLIYLMLGYDLIKDNKNINSTLSQNLNDKLIRPSIKLLENSGAPNQAAWNLAAKVIAGYLIEDPILVYNSIYEKDGFNSLIKKNITKNGEWKEGSWSYFFYAIEPILLITESSLRRGINLYSEPINKLLTSPAKQILPDGSLPSFGDTRNKIYPKYYNYVFRIGQKRFNYNQLSETPTSNIKDILSLIWTYDIVSSKQNHTIPMHTDSESDTIILRNNSNYGDKYLALKHSSNTPHSHLDNLSYIYSSNSKEYIIDPGTTKYSHILAINFYNQTIAHNTVIVNEESHKNSKGQVVSSYNSPKLSLLHAKSKYSYNDIVMDRMIILKPEYFIDIFNIDSSNEAPKTIDFSIHSPLIETNKLLKSTSPFSAETPHKYLQDISSAIENKDWNYTIIPYNSSKNKLDFDSPLHATIIGQENTKIIKASYKNPRNKNNSVILIRREVPSTSFITLYQHKKHRSEEKPLVIEKKNLNSTRNNLITIKSNDFIDYHYLWNEAINNQQQTPYTFHRSYNESTSYEILISGINKSIVDNIEINANSYDKYIYFNFNDLTGTLDIYTANPDIIDITIKPKIPNIYNHINVNGINITFTKDGDTLIIKTH